MLDGVDQARFDRLRYVEIKHGRKSTFLLRTLLNSFCVSKMQCAHIDYDTLFAFPGIAMLAVLGHIHTAFGARVPGNIDYSGTSFASIKTGLAGLKDIPTAGLLQIVAFIGFLELFVMKDKGSGEFPGDLRNGMFTWKGSAEELMQKRAIELNNGRAAQMGILALMVHEKLDGEPYVINALFGNPSNFNAGL
jgi:Chlorophyll A-B binding protein